MHAHRRLAPERCPLAQQSMAVSKHTIVQECMCTVYNDFLMVLLCLFPRKLSLHRVVSTQMYSCSQNAVLCSHFHCCYFENATVLSVTTPTKHCTAIQNVTTLDQGSHHPVSWVQELLELMDVRLVEIDDRWESGRLQACGFSSQEVIHVVKALFEDTDMRRRVLHNVAST